MIIDKVNNPGDLKNLTFQECDELAEEIRQLLLQKASEKGGHLGSNLGMIEASIALHYVFNSPKDKIIFDVSHQCYTHKILTGRKEGFTCPQKYDLYSGYTNPNESEHDQFRVGHTSTSISLACGRAKARDLKGEKENIIAIIGDGSLSGGEAFEGLDYGGSELNSNLIIIFNDNQMSIAENHGGIYKNIQHLRETNGLAKNNFFKTLGYDYVFVKNGNDISSLVKAFRSVQDIDHPVVVHICTQKGKGYWYSEQYQEQTHWVRPFDKETGEERRPFNGERYDRIVRDYLMEKMEKDPRVVTMIAAVPDALAFSPEKRKEIGKQIIDVGIAEEHAISMAAGIAHNGGKPVFSTLATFYQRTYDQISQELCINKEPAVLIVVNASVYAPNDITHIGIFDIAMMSNIPNLVYLAPTNKQEYLSMLEWAIDQEEWPVAIRAPRNGVFNAKGTVDTDYSKLNKYEKVIEGEKIAIIALGDFFQLGEELAVNIIERYGFSPTLINPRYITGVDEEMLRNLTLNHKLVITLEDGIIEGGFGEKIANFYGTEKILVKTYGLKKKFIDRYNIDDMLKENHLRPELIIKDIDELKIN